jgi:hypothetical protein
MESHPITLEVTPQQLAVLECMTDFVIAEFPDNCDIETQIAELIAKAKQPA